MNRYIFYHFSKSVPFIISTMDMLNCARFDERWFRHRCLMEAQERPGHTSALSIIFQSLFPPNSETFLVLR